MQEYLDKCAGLVAKLEREVRDLESKSYEPKIAQKIQFRQRQIAAAKNGRLLRDVDDVAYEMTHHALIADAINYGRSDLFNSDADTSHQD